MMDLYYPAKFENAALTGSWDILPTTPVLRKKKNKKNVKSKNTRIWSKFPCISKYHKSDNELSNPLIGTLAMIVFCVIVQCVSYWPVQTGGDTGKHLLMFLRLLCGAEDLGRLDHSGEIDASPGWQVLPDQPKCEIHIIVLWIPQNSDWHEYSAPSKLVLVPIFSKRTEH